MASNSSALLLPSPGSSNTVAEGLRPSRGVVDVPSPWAWIGWMLFAMLVAVLAAWLWRWWKRRPRPVIPSIPPMPPHLRARARLVDAMHWIGEPRVFCTTVSAALRDYLEECFHFHAPDRTTEEFLVELQISPRLSRDQKLILAQFLERCDLVKFARDEPTRTDLENLHQSAMRLVVETSPNGGADDGPSVAGKPVELLEPGKTSTNRR